MQIQTLYYKLRAAVRLWLGSLLYKRLSKLIFRLSLKKEE